MDDLDRALVRLFSEEPRIGVLEASRRLKVARGTVQSRLDKLVESGVIVDWSPTLDPEAIRRMLVEQVTGRVRWRESVIWMTEEGGVTRFAEAGAGKALAGMVKRIAPDADAVSLNGPADLEAFAASL